MTSLSATASTARENARSHDGKFGHQVHDRADRVDLAGTQDHHPGDQPGTNPALDGIPSQEHRPGRRTWLLDREQATAYADSIGTSSAKRVAQIGGEEFRVDEVGQLHCDIDLPDDGGVTVWAEHGTARTASRLYIEGDLPGGYSYISSASLDTDSPDATATVDVSAELGTDEHQHTEEVEGFDTGEQVTEWSPAGFRDFLGRAASERVLREAIEEAQENAESQAEDPSEAARDAYLRGIGVRS